MSRENYAPGEIENESRRVAVEQGAYYDPTDPARFFEFCRSWLTLREGLNAGQPLDLLPYQRYCAGEMLGWKNADGTRLTRKVYISVPAGSGKNVFVEALGLWHILLDGEVAPLVVSAALSRDQAGIVWEGMNHQISTWPDDRKQKLIRHGKPNYSIDYYPGDGKPKGRFRCLPADGADKIKSESVSLAIVNEFAYWKKPDLYAALDSRYRSRRQPLEIVITTAGDLNTECYSLYRKHKKILNSEAVLTDHFGFIAEADEGCAVDDKRQWAKANVALDVAIESRGLALAAASAKTSRVLELAFRRERLNNFTQSLTRFLNLDAWDQCRLPEKEWPDLAGQVAYFGVDISRRIDLTSLVWVVVHKGKYYVRSMSWVPEETAKRQNNARYAQYVRDGDLVLTPGNATDQRMIRAKIKELAGRPNCGTYKVGKIVVENRESHLLQQQLIDDWGIDKVHGPNPGFAEFNEPTKALERLVLDRKLVVPRKGDDDILRWQAGNLQVKVDDSQRLRPSKGKSPDKIDTMVALIWALAGAVQHDEDKPIREPVYRKRGILWA